MADLNRITLIGRLTKDAEKRYLPSSAVVASFDLAVNRGYKDKSGNFQKETLFIKVNFWGRQVEQLSEFLKKGKQVFVDGRLRQRQWETTDGQKRSVMEVETLTVLPIERIVQETEKPAAGAEESYSPPDESNDDVPF